jgi:hypothetical protein
VKVRSVDPLVRGIVNNKAGNVMTSSNAVLMSDAMKYLRSEILLRKNTSDELITES